MNKLSNALSCIAVFIKFARGSSLVYTTALNFSSEARTYLPGVYVIGRARMNIALFLISILIIFIGCDLFTNGIEWIGRKFKLSERVVGSILAAIGTALPETFMPIVAIFFISGGSKAQPLFSDGLR